MKYKNLALVALISLPHMIFSAQSWSDWFTGLWAESGVKEKLSEMAQEYKDEAQEKITEALGEKLTGLKQAVIQKISSRKENLTPRLTEMQAALESEDVDSDELVKLQVEAFINAGLAKQEGDTKLEESYMDLGCEIWSQRKALINQ